MNLTDPPPDPVPPNPDPDRVGTELGRLEGLMFDETLELRTLFPLSKTEVMAETIRVYVDEALVPHTFFPDLNEVEIAVDNAGGGGSLVRVTYSYTDA